VTKVCNYCCSSFVSSLVFQLCGQVRDRKSIVVLHNKKEIDNMLRLSLIVAFCSLTDLYSIRLIKCDSLSVQERKEYLQYNNTHTVSNKLIAICPNWCLF